jgi:hypothetical protein
LKTSFRTSETVSVHLADPRWCFASLHACSQTITRQQSEPSSSFNVEVIPD